MTEKEPKKKKVRELTLDDLASIRGGTSQFTENKGPTSKVNGVEGSEGKLPLGNHNETLLEF